jgi:Uma2 family endonuclease
MIRRSTQTRQFGPADHGRRLSYDEFVAGDYLEGYKYELINGELYVSPKPGGDHDWIAVELFGQLLDYARDHPTIINYVTPNARIFVPNREDVTAPEPDIAAYQNYPRRRPVGGRQWQNVSPLLVAEVVSPDTAEKDLVRNVDLYFLVPSIKEYWAFDLRETAESLLTVYRRQARKWKVLYVAAGEAYSTRLLPGFEFVVEPNEEPED